MIALQLSHLDKTTAKGLCLEFILHIYAKTLALAAQAKNSQDLETLFGNPLDTPFFAKSNLFEQLSLYARTLAQTTNLGVEFSNNLEELRCWALQYRVKDPIQPSHVFKRLQALYLQLIPVLEQCADCEVALISLAELREPLNAWLGPQTIEQLLQRLFPEGPEQFRQAVSDKFEKRGFGDYPQKNRDLLAKVTWPRAL